MKRTALTALVVSAVVATACSSGKSTSQPPASASSAPAYTPVFTKEPCNNSTEPRFECGKLTVPEDRSKPGGRQVVLPVVVVKTADPNPAPDPVVYFSGGPGYPGITEANAFLRKGQTGNRDVILFDQRGTGSAEPSLDCPEVHEATATILGAVGTFETEGKVLMDALVACRDRLVAGGVDLNQYNTATVAQDVADLRVAMGIPEWNLFGVSYGTMLAQVVMRAHPEGVRSVVLDSVVPTDVGTGGPEVVASFERVKRVFFAGCAADERCATAFPTLEQDVDAVFAGLDASPYQGSIEVPSLGRQIPIAITGADAAAGLFNAFYDSDVIPQLPGIIQIVKNGGGGAIIDQITIDGIEFVNGAAEAQTAAVNCFDRAKFLDPTAEAKVAREHPHDTTLLLVSAVSCSDLRLAPAPDGFNDPVRSDLPTLVLANEYDPVTPPENSKHVADGLSRATFVLFPGLGHAAVFAQPECPELVFRAFLADPAAAVDTSCVAEMGPPAWAIP